MADKAGPARQSSPYTENGWVQGSTTLFSSIKMYGVELSTPELFDYKDDDIALVISQSCDIAFQDLNLEPYVEVLILREITANQLKSHLKNCNNPRILQIEYKSRCFEVCAARLCVMKKEFLRNHICENVLCPLNEMDSGEWKKFLETLKQFRANRYVRTAMPNTFDDLTRSLFNSNKWKKRLEKLNSEIQRLYLRIEPFAESERYSVGIFALVDRNLSAEKVTDIESMMEEFLIKPLAKIESITVQNVGEEWKAEGLNTIMKDYEVTLDILESFKPYYYDHISIKHDQPK